MSRVFALCSLLVSFETIAAAPPSSAKPKLVVLQLSAAGGIDDSVGLAMTEAITGEVGKKGYFDVISQKEIQTFLAQERQKQMLGCGEEASSCLSELAGAAGARFILTGAVAKLGDAYQLTLQTLDSQKTQPLGRSTRIAKSLDVLRAGLPYAVAEATGTPPPSPPSKVLPITLMAVGGAAVLGGGLWGLMALGDEQRYAGELQSGTRQAGVLQEQLFYQREAQRLGTQKTISLAVMAAGVVLMGLGIFFMPGDVGSGSGTAVAVVPTQNGGALVGVFP